MSDVVAVALITGGVAIISGLAGSWVGWWLERGRWAHQREMRLLDWRHQDRLERLAPIRDYLDSVSREVTNFALATGVGDQEGIQKYASRLELVMEQQQHANFRSRDVELGKRLGEVAQCVLQALQTKDAPEAVIAGIGSAAASAWDRLEELQTEL